MDLKINEGLIFRNKSENEKAPLFTGQINVDGKNWEIALWPRQNDNGKFYSVRISEPYNKAQSKGKSQGELKPKPKPRREEDEDLFA